VSDNLHEAGSDHGGKGSSVSFSLANEVRLEVEKLTFLTQSPPPLVFQNA
jgi:hypothetical protein